MATVWEFTLSSDVVCWPEESPVSSSGDLHWAIAFADRPLLATHDMN
jgi:hypothetical protein